VGDTLVIFDCRALVPKIPASRPSFYSLYCLINSRIGVFILAFSATFLTFVIYSYQKREKMDRIDDMEFLYILLPVEVCLLLLCSDGVDPVPS
jgi:ABC-type Co2+ transport system permease subunit